jgi:hypothetical protein
MPTRTVLSQGEVRPGIVQGQYWREDHPRRDRFYTPGPDGEQVPVYVMGGYQPPATFGLTPDRRADPRLSHRVER